MWGQVRLCMGLSSMHRRWLPSELQVNTHSLHQLTVVLDTRRELTDEVGNALSRLGMQRIHLLGAR